MKKILLTTLLFVNLEAEDLGIYLKKCEPKKDTSCFEMKNLFTTAITSFRQHKLNKAIESFKMVIEKAEKKKLEPSQFYNNLGLVYNNNKDYDNALKYFKRCMLKKKNLRCMLKKYFIPLTVHTVHFFT